MDLQKTEKFLAQEMPKTKKNNEARFLIRKRALLFAKYVLYFQGFLLSRARHEPVQWPYRLSVRTQDFQSWKPGATPGRVTNMQRTK